jgi:hypothetical protein
MSLSLLAESGQEEKSRAEGFYPVLSLVSAFSSLSSPIPLQEWLLS